jgi:hypothetical protein
MANVATIRGKRRRPPRKQAPIEDAADWSLLSSHGKVVLYLALCPDSSTQQIAAALARTERAVARTLSALRGSGIVRARTLNRRKLFNVDMDATLYHPTLKGYTLRQVFGGLREEVRRNGRNICDHVP